MTCAYDGCQLTGDVQKGKYVYYRCTGYHGKCDLPRFREEDISDRLGEPLKNLQVPRVVVNRIVTMLREDQKQAAGKVDSERVRLQSRLTAIRNRMDAAYVDKLDGKIPEEFWERKMSDWRMEEQQVEMAIQGLDSADSGDRALDARVRFRTRKQGVFTVHFAESSRKGQVAQNATFELKYRRHKCNAHIQIPLRPDLQKCQNGEMVGTTRFEPATSPTPILETTQSE